MSSRRTNYLAGLSHSIFQSEKLHMYNQSPQKSTADKLSSSESDSVLLVKSPDYPRRSPQPEHDILDQVLNQNFRSPARTHEQLDVLNKWKITDMNNQDSYMPQKAKEFFPQSMKLIVNEDYLQNPQSQQSSANKLKSIRFEYGNVQNPYQSSELIKVKPIMSPDPPLKVDRRRATVQASIPAPRRSIPIARSSLIQLQEVDDIEDFFKIDNDAPTNQQEYKQFERPKKFLSTLYSLTSFTDWVEELFGKNWFIEPQIGPSPLKRARTQKVDEDEFMRGLAFHK